METACAVHPAERLLEAIRARRPERIRLALLDARDLWRVLRIGGLDALGFSNPGDLAESLGLSADEGRRLLSLAGALDGWPGVPGWPGAEERLLDGRLNPDKAASLARLLEIEGATRPDDTWLAWAEQESTADFQRRVNRRCEEALRGEPVEKIGGWVSQDGVASFRRARKILSRKAERRVSRGEAIEVLAEYYLDREDPMRVEARRRRLADTEEIPGERTIPAEVRRAVRARARDRCEFPRCSFDTWLEFAHIFPHRLGGSREAHNLLFLCGTHHRAMDGGVLRVHVSEGKAHFTNRWGMLFDGPLLAPRPPDG